MQLEDLRDFGELRRRPDRPGTIVGSDEHERQLAELDGARIHVRVITADDPLLLELSNPLEHGRRRKPDLPRDLGIGDPRVLLQKLHYFSI